MYYSVHLSSSRGVVADGEVRKTPSNGGRGVSRQRSDDRRDPSARILSNEGGW